VLVKDQNNSNCPPLQVFVRMSKSTEAGVKMTFYVKNVVINNTDQKFFMYYGTVKALPAAGQFSSADNSIVMLNEVRRQI
jgi:hypothetical protein